MKAKTNRTFFQLIAFLCVVIMTSACSTHTNSFDIEAKASMRTRDWLEKNYGFVNEPQIQAFLNRLLLRLASATSTASLAVKIPRNETPVLTAWRIFILKSEEPNAFAIGGGTIVISSSLFMLCRTESELASIISHEMSHQMLGHIQKALVDREAHSGNNGTPAISYSIEHEIQADRLGLMLLNLARYDVQDSLAALSLGYRRSTHAVSDDWMEMRISRLRAMIGNKEYSPYTTRTSREFNRCKRLLSQSTT